MGTLSYLAGRVDAARNLARVPGRGPEATGRLFVAKRCHEACKAGDDVLEVLPDILAEVLDGLDAPAHDGARAEATEVGRALGGSSAPTDAA